jgi:hypothetical protein
LFFWLFKHHQKNKASPQGTSPQGTSPQCHTDQVCKNILLPAYKRREILTRDFKKFPDQETENPEISVTLAQKLLYLE